MKRLLSIALFLVASFAWGVRPTISLDVHASTSNGATSSTTVVVGPFTPTAGDGITCAFYPSFGTVVSVQDNVNAGSYSPASIYSAVDYKANVAHAATTITLTVTSATTGLMMACEAWKPSSSGYTFMQDAAMSAYIHATGANPNTGSLLTPGGGNELLYGYLDTSASVTAGSNYTLLDTLSYSATYVYPEYWLQSTATASNAPYIHSVSLVYTDYQVAFYFGTPGASTGFDGGTFETSFLDPYGIWGYSECWREL